MSGSSCSLYVVYEVERLIFVWNGNKQGLKKRAKKEERTLFNNE